MAVLPKLPQQLVDKPEEPLGPLATTTVAMLAKQSSSVIVVVQFHRTSEPLKLVTKKQFKTSRFLIPFTPIKIPQSEPK
jgi:hypothetical protein